MAGAAQAADDVATITIHADKLQQVVSPFMTGACIEDVNHEIYGGLYSQMIFGESFAEPARAIGPKGFEAFGGNWQVNKDGELTAGAGMGPKLVSKHAAIAAGEVGVEIRFADKTAGLAGLIIKVNQPAVGADRWIGYEVSLDPARQVMVIGRHRNNWEHIKDVACEVPVGHWIKLGARMMDDWLEVLVNGKVIFKHEGVKQLPAGAVGLRTWQRGAEFRDLWVKTGEQVEKLPFEGDDAWASGVSGMWRGIRKGTAEGRFSIETAEPFTGKQSQRIAFESGEGEIGIENRGLNRQGMSFIPDKEYWGEICFRAQPNHHFYLALESADGKSQYAEYEVPVKGDGWEKHQFFIRSNETDHNGRFVIKLKKPGNLTIGYVFLQPGEWGRYRGLPVRNDVVEGIVGQGITVLRYGGSMVNAPEYRWKKMLGPREKRPGYRGTWYEHSSNGWGIIDFLNLCEAMGVMGVPAFNMDETPEDMADFIEYVNGSAQSECGKKRVADGHPVPYGLKHLELGNEEAVDEAYRARFEPMVEAIWKKDPNIIPVIGDFEYKQVITDPYHFKGAPRITSLASHEKILKFARERRKPVWFDFHIWNDKPGDCKPHLAALASVAGWFGKLAPGAEFQISVFEENANHHGMGRALAHAETINGLMRLADRVPIVCAANGLQVDGQNDNGWDQGLLFMNSWKVWNQPPGLVSRMISRGAMIRGVEVESKGSQLDVFARLSADRRVVALQVVNTEAQAVKTHIAVQGLQVKDTSAQITQVSGQLSDVNTAADPLHIAPQVSQAALAGGQMDVTFAGNSVTVIQIK